MKIQTKEIDHFLEDRVSEGVCSSAIEAERQLASQLAERELDRNLAEAEADMKAGRYTEMTEENTAEFIQKLAKKILPSH